MSWIFGAHECWLCMAKLPEANSTTVRNSYHLWAACPCLSWSTVAMHVLTWVIFTPGFFHADAALCCTHRCTHAYMHSCITYRIHPNLCTYTCAYTHHSVPEPLDVEFGELKQGRMCLDTLSHHAGQGIGMFECHGMGGNQVSHHGNVTMVTWYYTLGSLGSG